MINKNRIVPVQATDLISLYSTICVLMQMNIDALEPVEIGKFVVDANGTYLANEPVKTLDFASGATAAEVLFVPAYDFEGITIEGVDEGITLEADGCSLYAASLSSGAVTVVKIGL